MYNSISQMSCLEAIQKLAKTKGWWKTYAQGVFWTKIITICHWVFATSYVGYDGKAFKQLKGLPMGSPLSPVLANLYMASLEEDVMWNSLYQDIIYLRYLDDVLMMCIDDSIEVSDYTGAHPAIDIMETLVEAISIQSRLDINFEATGSASNPGESVEFLDLELGIVEKRKRNGRTVQVINLRVFDKPTNLHIYTDPSTFYPFHYVYNWIQGENIRLIRNSSTDEAYDSALYRFKQFLFRRNYCESLVDKFVALNSFDDRAALLQGEKPHQNKDGLGKDVKSNRYVIIRNEGSRLILTRGISILNNLLAAVNETHDRLIPVVSKGRSIISVMNKTRKI